MTGAAENTVPTADVQSVAIDTRQPNLSDKLAAALLTLGDIEYEHAKLMTAAQIISLYHFDHYPIRRESGGPTAPWNLVPRLIAAHRDKTARVDHPEIAKGRDVRASEAQHRAAMASKEPGQKRPRRGAIPSRPFQKGHRPLSRNNFGNKIQRGQS